ncbi:MAG: amidohydrolase family protein [Armatimonadetes bacterium]|nr:amidohydrolase family protein [Armatimonadota bacterium]
MLQALIADGLILADGKDYLPQTPIFIEGGRIVSFAGDIEAVENKIVLNGFTLMPGLIDAHVHLVCSPDEPDLSSAHRLPVEALLLRALANAQAALRAGITSLRDCGSRGFIPRWLKEASAAGQIALPRIQLSGPPITTTAGHLADMGMAADDAPGLQKAVRQVAAGGADFVKVIATGGGLTPGSNVRRAQYSLEEMEAAVREAARLEKKVAVHAHGTEGIRNSVRAGVHSVEHCTWLGPQDGYEYDESLEDEIVRRGIYISHTIAFERVVPDADWQKTRSEGPGIPYRFYRQALDRGASLVIASDAGIPRTRFEEYPRSLEVAVKLMNLSPLEAIRAATKTPARMLGWERDLGTLDIGKYADLIAVPGNPLEDITSLRRAAMVMLGGVRVNP